MRSLADLSCLKCGLEYYGDLPTGQGLYTPFLLEKLSGTVYGSPDVPWYSDWLENSYKQRTSRHRSLEIRSFSKAGPRVILLNCLDTLYGHSLLKLLNAQRYLDHFTKDSLVVIAPRFLEWMLPNWIAEAWLVDLPLRDGTEWNDRLANEIAERLGIFEEVFLSPAFSHPHPDDFDIERFTRVKPFNLERFGEQVTKPIVTFIWRDDRLWGTESTEKTSIFGGLKSGIAKQIEKVIRLAEDLLDKFAGLDLAIAGIGKSGRFPSWIKDLRSTAPDDEEERMWCERYAASHVVIGMHGSNMLLPSAHAACIIDIMPAEREGNFLQDLLLRGSDPRDVMFRYRFVPDSVTPENLTNIVATLLKYRDFERLMSRQFGE